MKMTSLCELHKSMLQIKATMQQFQFSTGAISFDCMFSTRETPFVLSLTSRGLNPSFFKFDVTSGYNISNYFKEQYEALAKLLKTSGKSGNKLIPKEFLANLNQQIPKKATNKASPSPVEIINRRPDITEDRDKPYFDTWIYWKTRKGPTYENQQKTLLLLGKEALNYSIQNKASSKWSVKNLERNWQLDSTN